jgi:hypothetical protein
LKYFGRYGVTIPRELSLSEASAWRRENNGRTCQNNQTIFNFHDDSLLAMRPSTRFSYSNIFQFVQKRPEKPVGSAARSDAKVSWTPGRTLLYVQPPTAPHWIETTYERASIYDTHQI